MEEEESLDPVGQPAAGYEFTSLHRAVIFEPKEFSLS